MQNLVIFDCDGVLVDSEHLANQALAECLADVGIHIDVAEATKRFQGRKLADCLAEIERDFTRELPDTFVSTFRAHTDIYFETKLQPIHGVEQAIQNIPFSKCVASNGPHLKIKKNLELVGLSQYFGDNIFSAYTIQKWKPEPDLFLHACKNMGGQIARSVVIEDSVPGIQAALAGGFKVLAYGIHTIHDKSVTSFKSMHELPALVRRAFSAEE